MAPITKRKREDALKTDGEGALNADLSAIESIFSGKGDFVRKDTPKFEEAQEMMVDRDDEAKPEEQLEAKSKKKKRTEKYKPKKVRVSELFGAKEKIIQGLRFSDMKEGVVVAGCVKDIYELDAVITLPDNLTGVLDISDVSAKLTDEVQRYVKAQEDEQNTQEVAVPDLKRYLKEGQFIMVRVKSVTENAKDGKKTVRLTALPERVNEGFDALDINTGMMVQGTVKSREDHGLIIDIGIKNCSGFVNKKNCPEFEKISVGSVVQGVAEKTTGTSKKMVVSMSMKPESLSTAKCSFSETLQVHNVQPGFLVDAKVTKVLESGLVVKLFDMFEGEISFLHAVDAVMEKLNVSMNEAKLEDFYEVGKTFKCRILCRLLENSGSSRRFALSLKTNLVSWQSSDLSERYDFGALIEAASIQSVDSKSGLYVQIDERTMGYCHLSKLSDTHMESIDKKKYPIGAELKMRVIGFDRLNDIVLLSSQESVLNASFFSYDDVVVGSVVKNAEVYKVDSVGKYLIIKLSPYVRGICTNTHLADAPSVSNIDKRFKVGDKVTCRVLNVDKDKKRVSVTLKKTLVNTMLPALVSTEVVHEMLQENDELWSIGVVAGLQDYGIFVNFFGNVSGLLPVSELGIQGKQKVEDLYKLGQIIKCRIARMNPNDGKLRLSMKTKTKEMPSWIEEGQVLGPCTVKGVLNDQGFLLEHKGVECFMPQTRVHDFESVNSNCFKFLKEGDELDQVVVLQKKSGSSAPVVSSKNLLVSARSESSNFKLPFSLSELAVGDLLVGCVRKIDNNIGVFVSFGSSLSGLAPKNLLSDRFVSKIDDLFKKSQTVFCVVSELDVNSNKLILSLKPSKVKEHFKDINELKAILAKSFFSHAELCPQYKEIGKEYECKITSPISDGLAFEVAVGDSIRGIVLKNNLKKGMLPSIGTKLAGKIADFDLNSNFVDIVCSKTESGKTAKNDSKSSSVLDAHVLLVKPDYIVCGTSCGKFIHCLTHLLSIENIGGSFQRGNKVNIRLISSELQGICLGEIIEDKSPAVSLDNFTTGSQVKATVKSIKNVQANVNLVVSDQLKGAKVPGRLFITEVFDEKELLAKDNLDSTKSVFDMKEIRNNSVINARVLGQRDAKTYKTLAITGGHTKKVLDLTIKPETSVPLTAEQIESGELLIGYISSIETDIVNSRNAMSIILSPTITAKVPVFEASLDARAIEDLSSHFVVGAPVKCAIIKKDKKSKNYFATLNTSRKHKGIQSIDDVEVNEVLPAKIIRVGDSFLDCKLSESGKEIYGRVGLTDINDDYSAIDLKSYKINQFVNAFVKGVNKQNGFVDLSLRASKISKKEETTVTDADITSIEDVTSGSVVRGFVANIGSGVFVQIGTNVIARVKISELSDNYIVDFKKAFSVGDLVKGKIMNITEDNKVEMSLKLSNVDEEAYKKLASSAKFTAENIDAGMIVTGTVSRVEEYGVFVDIDDSSCGKGNRPIRALCHRSQVSDEAVSDVTALYNVGDRVKAVVLKKDQKGKLQLGLKPSYFEDIAEDSDDDEVMSEKSDDSSMEVDDEDAKISAEETAPMEVEQVSSDVENEEEKEVDTIETPVIGLQKINWSSSWNMDESDNSDSNESDLEEADSDSDNEKTLTRNQKKKAKRDEEIAIQKHEADVLAGKIHEPKSVQDFKKLVMASPNSSFLWIQYMAFHLQKGELDMARQTAEKALETINYREEKEKLNVWMAYLNMESKFGTEESFKTVFGRAVQFNDAKAVYMKMAQSYEQNDMFDKAEDLFKKMIKKFSSSSKVWLAYCLYWIQRDNFAEARKLCDRALQVLPKRKHVKALIKFAQYEFKYGTPERGRTIFEGLLSNYPKRVDIWAVYLDKEIQQGDLITIRRLFERSIHLDLSAKKMKFLFKKYLDFEKKYGDDITIAHVIESATEFVNKLNGNNEESEVDEQD